ncbi:hypothetical protein MTO96_044511 [Rhipicephalus appendiculatus]
MNDTSLLQETACSDSSTVEQLIEEQRQLRLSLERSKDKELQLRERQLKLDQAAAEREERLISVLEKMAGS